MVFALRDMRKLGKKATIGLDEEGTPAVAPQGFINSMEKEWKSSMQRSQRTTCVKIV